MVGSETLCCEIDALFINTPSIYPYRLDYGFHAADGLDNRCQIYTGGRLYSLLYKAFSVR